MSVVHVQSQVRWQSVPHTRTDSRETSVAETSACVCNDVYIVSDVDQSWGRPGQQEAEYQKSDTLAFVQPTTG